MRSAWFRSVLLEFVVFTSGALVMIYEITGSRLLAPYLGSSLYIWTSLIGVILGSLSVGYWLGGKIADRKQDVRTLSIVLMLGSAVMTLTILTKDRILGAISGLSFALEVKALVAALILFAPVSLLFGFVAPYVTRLRMSSLDDSGATVGRLYALSTCGSIVGTFAAGFFLIPFVGSTRILYLIAATLLVLSLLLAPWSLKKTRAAVVILLLVVVGISELKIYAYRVRRDVHDFDTRYDRVRILRGWDHRTAQPVRLMVTDPYSAQSIMFLDKDNLVFDYTKYYHLIRHFNPNFKNTLMIGGAGYSFPKDYLRAYPQAKIDVVEIDPGKTALARKFFRLKEDPHLKIIHEDGRAFLNAAETGKYDAVLMDAFSAVFSIPFQLTTLEAAQNMHRTLTEDGIVVLNLISAFQGKKSKFFAAEFNTFARVFPYVYSFKVDDKAADDSTQNIIIVASRKSIPVSVDRVTADPEIAELLAHRFMGTPPQDVAILTDDTAPVEFYNSFSEKFGH